MAKDEAADGDKGRHKGERPPDERPVTRRQAAYLASETGVGIDDLAGQPIGKLEGLLRWRIDPHLLFFRKVCGRVVRTDPVTGIVHGVPNATVHVEDTDCSFLGFFPVEQPWWWWLWPISCHREEIATTTTDACGRFCVYIPRWDIDRLLRFRLERVCFPEIVKPTVRDVIEWLELPPHVRPSPWPGPDPGPLVLRDRELVRRVAEVLPQGVTDRLLGEIGPARFGSRTDDLAELASAPAFAPGSFPPPLSAEALERIPDIERREPDAGAAEAQGKDLLDRRYVGPFLRCRDVVVAEWVTIFDVPDITFRVSQDVDLDGDEETVYDEGFFDVRWDAGPIPSPVLEAWPWARVSETCDGPDIACVDEPAIRTVGLMPLEPTHVDADGYSTRVNRPRPLGLSSDPQTPCGTARSPFAGTLQLHGCHHLPGAEFYRLTYQYRPTLADPLSGEVPFTALEWWAPRLTPGGPFHVVPDGDGWYPVLPESQLVFPHWLLNWPSASFPHGQYVVRLYLADGAKNPIPGMVSDPVALTVDNRAPNAGFTMFRWRRVGDPVWSPLPAVCPVIDRPGGTVVEVQVTWWANAVHLRDGVLWASGCGGGNPVPDGPAADFDHWHQTPGDNGFARVAVFRLQDPATGSPLSAGCYTFGVDAHTRAFNPAGDGGGPGLNWCTDYAYRHAHPSVAISVVDV